MVLDEIALDMSFARQANRMPLRLRCCHDIGSPIR